MSLKYTTDSGSEVDVNNLTIQEMLEIQNRQLMSILEELKEINKHANN